MIATGVCENEFRESKKKYESFALDRKKSVKKKKAKGCKC